MTSADDWSVVVPVLNEADELGGLLAGVAGAGEVWVVDGGSDDGSRTIARRMGAHVITGVRGRGRKAAGEIGVVREGEREGEC